MQVTDQDTEEFTSHMLKALRALTNTELELMNAQARSRTSTEDDNQAWELLWHNLRSATTLASVIRASALSHDADAGTSQISASVRTPLVPTDSPQFRPLVDAVEDAMRCAEQMSRSAADAFERLIYAGHGESDCALTVTMVRLYGQAAECLLETVRSELAPIRASTSN